MISIFFLLLDEGFIIVKFIVKMFCGWYVSKLVIGVCIDGIGVLVIMYFL